jgi:hypothetical protein
MATGERDMSANEYQRYRLELCLAWNSQCCWCRKNVSLDTRLPNGITAAAAVEHLVPKGSRNHEAVDSWFSAGYLDWNADSCIEPDLFGQGDIYSDVRNLAWVCISCNSAKWDRICSVDDPDHSVVFSCDPGGLNEREVTVGEIRRTIELASLQPLLIDYVAPRQPVDLEAADLEEDDDFDLPFYAGGSAGDLAELVAEHVLEYLGEHVRQAGGDSWRNGRLWDRLDSYISADRSADSEIVAMAINELMPQANLAHAKQEAKMLRRPAHGL